MDSGTVLVQLKALTQAEEMLIAKGCLVMRVYRLKGGQRGYGGHVVNLAQNVADFVKRLSRAAKDLPIVVVRRLGGDDTHKDLLVRRQRVFDAIVWLQANKPFLPMYFERRSKLGEKHTFQLRLREEVRLKTLAEETLGLHGVGA